MATRALRPIDVFEALTPKEKRQVLALLKKSEQSPCEAKGHQYRPIGMISTGLFSPVATKMCCTRCGHSIIC